MSGPNGERPEKEVVSDDIITARRGWGPGEPGPKRPLFTVNLYLERKLKSMKNYRSLLESKLKALDKERKRLMGALKVLQELDSEDENSDDSVKVPENGHSQPDAGPTKMIDAIEGILQSSGRLMTTKEVESELSKERKVGNGSVYVALHRLRERGAVVKEKSLWRFSGPVDVV